MGLLIKGFDFHRNIGKRKALPYGIRGLSNIKKAACRQRNIFEYKWGLSSLRPDSGTSHEEAPALLRDRTESEWALY
jgi:hypothetical protein